jgi:hypothetical protein
MAIPQPNFGLKAPQDREEVMISLDVSSLRRNGKIEARQVCGSLYD